MRIQHTRFFEVPFNRDLFLIYFSFTYGMIEFSYVTVIFGAKSMKTTAPWTLFLYVGWMATALISQHVGIDDRTIDIGRDMSNARAEDRVHVLLFNSLLVFNMGIPILYIIWTAIRSRESPGTAGQEPNK